MLNTASVPSQCAYSREILYCRFSFGSLPAWDFTTKGCGPGAAGVRIKSCRMILVYTENGMEKDNNLLPSNGKYFMGQFCNNVHQFEYETLKFSGKIAELTCDSF